MAALKSAFEQDPDGTFFIAGGQSLLPSLAVRGVQPRQILDIAKLPELHALDLYGDRIFIGAAVTLTELLERGIAAALPVMASALLHVGNITIRNRATVGGCLAWADARAELPLICLLYQGVVVTSARRIAMDHFLEGPNKTVLAPGELVIGVEIPRPQAHAAGAFRELMPRKSLGRAIVSVAVADVKGSRCIAVGGIWSKPVTAPVVAIDTVDKWIDRVSAITPTLSDVLFPIDYRIAVLKAFIQRAMREAWAL